MARSQPFLSAFTGLGGLDLGLEKAGFRNVGCIEFDETARKSIHANHPHRKLIEPHDIVAVAGVLRPRHLRLRKRELFILAGGPPCQPFSKAAQWSHKAMRGLRDPRSKCFAGFIQLIESFLPSVVLIENVQGFVANSAGALQKLRRSLRQINRKHGTQYHVEHWVVDASDYGVPQRRKRAILIAHRDGVRFSFPAPTTRENPVTAWDALGSLVQCKRKPTQPGHWGRLLGTIPEGQNYLWHTRCGGGRPLFGYRTRFWSFLLKLAKTKPAWTIPAQPGPYTGPFHWENRPLTQSELLRLQSFPASWKVRGRRVDRVRQIGNATPPLLAEIIGRELALQLLGRELRDGPKLEIKRSSKVPSPPTRLAAIPRSFRHLIRRHDDHPGTGLGPAPILTSTPDAKNVRKVA